MAEPTNQHTIKELNLLINISQKIISALDYEEVMQIISDGMSELLEIETAAIYMLENDNELILGATTPPLDPQMPKELRKALLDDHPHIKKAIETRQTQWIQDFHKIDLTKAERVVVEMRQLKSLIFLPFVQKDKVLGVLILGTCNKSRVFSEHEIDLGQTVANQLSVSIQNALLHDDLKNHKQNLERLIQEKTKDLDAAIEELRATNEELFSKNEIIYDQNAELKATLQNLKETQSQLIQIEKMASLGILTSGVAHEINNPLNYLMGAYFGIDNYFKENFNEADSKIPVFLESLKNGIERISTIVKGLNQFSRNNGDLNEDCHIHSIIDNCLLMLNNQIGQKVAIRKNYAEETGIVKGNVGKLHQVVLNILLNAIQAMDYEGNLSIKTIADKKNRKILIEISDTGIGINSEIIGKITDPFFTTKEPGKGIGLGLSIAYNIIQEHNGQFDFESEPGNGTNVRLMFPLVEAVS